MTTCDLADLIGVPFRDGGRGPAGYDCYGLAQEIFRRYGTILPDYRIACEDAAAIDAAVDEARPLWRRCEGEPPVPSLVLFKFNQMVFCNHVGMYIGGGRFIHTRKGANACIERVDSPIWRHRIEGFYVPVSSGDAEVSLTEQS